MSEKRSAAKKRFLVVDDEGFMAYVVSRMLRDFHAEEVVRASDGLEAIEMFTQDRLYVDCVIADFNMKPLNGLQLLRKIRTGQVPNVRRDQPLIMLTGNAQSGVVKTALLLDVNAYLVKPVAASKLDEALERVLSGTQHLKSIAAYKAIDMSVSDSFNDADDKHSRTSVPH